MKIKRTTGIQRITIALLIAYVIWEIAVRIWAGSLPPHDPVIRGDLVFIYPLLSLFVGISIFQYIRQH